MTRQKTFILIALLASTFAAKITNASCIEPGTHPHASLSEEAVAQALGWVKSDENRCGGYYIEAPLLYPQSIINTDKLYITSDQGLFAFHGTSISQGRVTITRAGQQITANKAYLYRDPVTGKLNAIDLFGDVHLHEPNQLVVAKSGHYNLKDSEKSLKDILYRSTIYGDSHVTPPPVPYQEQQKTRKVTQLSAWGKASTFTQQHPMIYDFQDVTYSTCPPDSRFWNVQAKTMELNKNTGRGHATHTFLYLKGIPVLYTPYFNFPIDSRRQTGFLFPKFGSSNRFGPYLMTPFYWNLAPNYDTTITPAFLSKRGLQLSDLYRYLTPHRSGQINVSVLPNDKQFEIFKQTSFSTYQSSSNPTTQSDLRTLENASTTRSAFSWQETGHYNDNWSSSINYNYVSDSYFMRDLNSNVQTVSDNQLLQQAEVDYIGPHWNFLTRVQSYQTLNPIDLPAPVARQYSRAPQMVLNGNYPDDKLGLEYFINNEATRFDIRNTPGDITKLPMGTRMNIQPGVSKPINLPYFYITPRVQFAMTKYELGHIGNDLPKGPSRALPIFDINSGFYFDRNISWLNTAYKQTLEPQIYYTYIPYVNQNRLPVFDTTLNTLTYDQLFTYNRFSSIDRIGDTNQVSLGLTTRFINNGTGFEKINAGIGEIFYFKKRSVTLCTAPNDCTNLINDPNNVSNRSPISGIFKYNVNPEWSATANTIWNVKPNRLNNQSIILQYRPDARRVINFGYNFVRSGDINLPWEPPNSTSSNLSQTDISASWPISRDWAFLGRWTENWNQRRLQNLLSGLQYDSCCWAVRFVAGRTFVAVNTNNTFQYNNQFFIEFSLKGLGNISPGGDPDSLLASSINGYQSNFGRDY